MKSKIINLINKLPHVRGLYEEVLFYKKNSCFRAGHYYSPIVLVDEMKERENEIWTENTQGVNLNTTSQLALLSQLDFFYSDLPFSQTKTDKHRYYFKNTWYTETDGYMLYALMRLNKPKQIIEVGSGFSSALMLDTNDLYFNNEIKLTFIDPNPEDRLNDLMNDKDKENAVVCKSFIQDIDLNIFKNLDSGDIVFIDSTHVSKTGSDVNFILFEILPILKQGVLIHFHDIFFPFEYPKEWVFGGRNWNEIYILKSFLMYNESFKIILFNDYLHKKHESHFNNMPILKEDFGGSIWLEKQ
jgi:predicted O-methyltransferase YrrM